jgi:hypothetical protein
LTIASSSKALEEDLQSLGPLERSVRAEEALANADIAAATQARHSRRQPYTVLQTHAPLSSYAILAESMRGTVIR